MVDGKWFMVDAEDIGHYRQLDIPHFAFPINH